MQFSLTFVFASIDPSLGRVDKASFSQHTLMDLLISGIENKSTLSGPPELPKDVTDWEGISLNDNDEIVEFNWANVTLNGSVQLEWLPSAVEKVSFESTGISGTVDLTCLPESLRVLNLADNALDGSIVLDSLPNKMLQLSVNENRLSGSLNLEHLPDSMSGIYLFENSFSGTICLTKLPKNFHFLSVETNKLCGTIDLTQLPFGITELLLNDNHFEGETDFSKLPKSLRNFSVANTRLSGEMPWVDPRRRHYNLRGSNVTMKNRRKG